MCEEFPPSNPRPFAWDRRALLDLKNGFHSTSSEFLHLLDEEEFHPAFDPIKVRNLLREEQAAGREPEFLILGRLEMASFHHFICRGFGEESGAPMPELYFLGIPVVDDPCPSRLEFVVEEGYSTNDPHERAA